MLPKDSDPELITANFPRSESLTSLNTHNSSSSSLTSVEDSQLYLIHKEINDKCCDKQYCDIPLVEEILAADGQLMEKLVSNVIGKSRDLFRRSLEKQTKKQNRKIAKKPKAANAQRAESGPVNTGNVLVDHHPDFINIELE